MPDPLTIATAAKAGTALLGAFAGGSAGKAEAQARSGAIAAASGAVSTATQQLSGFNNRQKTNTRIYGKFERDRLRAYEDINVEAHEARGLTNVRRSIEQAKRRVESAAAARGLDRSGLTEQQLFDLDIEQARQEAEVRYQAPLQVGRILTEAIQPGLQREARLDQASLAASGQVVSAQSTLAQLQAGFAGTANVDKNQAFGVGIGAALDASGAGDISSFLKSFGGA